VVRKNLFGINLQYFQPDTSDEAQPIRVSGLTTTRAFFQSKNVEQRSIASLAESVSAV
jgi:hypothetical protein